MVRLPASTALARGRGEAMPAEGVESTPVGAVKMPDASPAGGRSCQGYQSPMDSFFDPRRHDSSVVCQSPMDRFFDGPRQVPSFFGPSPGAAATPTAMTMPAAPAGCVMMPLGPGGAWPGNAMTAMAPQVWVGGAVPPQAMGGAQVQMMAVPAAPGHVPAGGAAQRQATAPAEAQTTPVPARAAPFDRIVKTPSGKAATAGSPGTATEAKLMNDRAPALHTRP
eukprot:CAMPEP_0195137848 /NCGR_PEP_ID=MMETSP0448-20130528/156681_1 /TAXON_ID=66468 /ORGANISM="Heterocapsa triquestra, Strain CCMP 448" /LENGTH=222 /DNA_ID=CAMNT_0040176097 /DNA_START=1 /DNA_END=666 /DNA_ORIENTATION=+